MLSVYVLGPAVNKNKQVLTLPESAVSGESQVHELISKLIISAGDKLDTNKRRQGHTESSGELL